MSVGDQAASSIVLECGSYQEGLTKREWLEGMAMAGLLASESVSSGFYDADRLAAEAEARAAAMIRRWDSR
jgi:hypothetical protein